MHKYNIQLFLLSTFGVSQSKCLNLNYRHQMSLQAPGNNNIGLGLRSTSPQKQSGQNCARQGATRGAHSRCITTDTPPDVSNAVTPAPSLPLATTNNGLLGHMHTFQRTFCNRRLHTLTPPLLDSLPSEFTAAANQ